MAGEKKRRQRKLVTATNLAFCGRPGWGETCEGLSQRMASPGTAHINALRTRGWLPAPGLLAECRVAPLSPCAPSLGGCPHAQEGTASTEAGGCTSAPCPLGTSPFDPRSIPHHSPTWCWGKRSPTRRKSCRKAARMMGGHDDNDLMMAPSSSPR